MTNSSVSHKQEAPHYQRKDSRKSFVKNQLLTARCETTDGMFSVSVKNLSSGGAFIYTKKKLTMGQEIAMTINLPNSEELLMVTGEVVRTSSAGYGVAFKIFFNA